MIFDLATRPAAGRARAMTTHELAERLAAKNITYSGVHVTPQSALTYAAVFACVRVLSEAVGTLPLNLFEQRGKTRDKALEHPLYQLLHFAPNDWMTAQEFWEWVLACLNLRGNAYAHINRVRGIVRELLPLAPGCVTPKQADDWTVTYEVIEKGVAKVYPASEILHVKLFSTDGLTGLSPIGWARQTIGFGLASQEHGGRLFSNNAKPGGVLSTDKPLTLEASKRLIANVEEVVGGLENSGKTLVLGDGMKWTQIGMSSQDAQWIEARKLNRSEVAGVFRVPPHFIADLERATFSNIEHQDLGFVKHALMPYLRRIEQRIWLSLLTPAEKRTYFAKFNQDGLLRGDAKSRAEALWYQMQGGALSPNEWRELEDRNPREGGDVFLTPANMAIDGELPGKPGESGGAE